MRRSLLILTVVVGVFALVIYTIVFHPGHPKEGANLRKITVAQAGDFFLYAPLYVAVDAGLFKKQGLAVSIVSTGGDDKTWAAVISGSASFGVADPTFVATSGQRGQAGQTIAGIVNGVPFWGLTFRPDVPIIQQPKDLKGFTVATFPEPSTAYVLQRKMFLDAGLPPQIRQGAFGTLLAMLQSSQADIALELEPNVSEAVSRGARIVYSMPQLYGDFAITGLTATPSLLQSDPGLSEGVICSLQLALDYIHKRPEDSLNILLHRFSVLNRNVARDALHRAIEQSIIPKDLVISKLAWSRAIGLRVDAGQLQQAGNYSEYLNTGIAEKVRSNPECRLP